MGRGTRDRVRFGVVGLGNIAQTAVLPAFANAEHAQLAALVSGDCEKRDKLAGRYGVRHAVDYDRLDDLYASGEIDAVYIATPNHLHCTQTIQAAKHGIHVLCEKPMAVTEAECEQMHRACEDAGVALMIAYRLHFDPANLEAIRTAQQELGDLRIFSSAFSIVVEAGDIRTGGVDQGGGSLYDIGIYCINAARYLFRCEPEEVFAFTTLATDPERGTAYDRLASVVLRFPEGRLASFSTCFDAAPRSHYRIVGTRGDLRLSPAYSYAVDMDLEVCVDGRARSQRYPASDQFGPELEYFATRVLGGEPIEPDWREGLADVRILRALHRSAREGRAVAVQPVPQRNRPEPDQAIHRPAIEAPEEVGSSGRKR